MLYQDLANMIAQQIDQGLLSEGDRIAGVRAMSQQRSVSPSTVVAAYRKLEQEGYLQARERSGFYVTRPTQIKLKTPQISNPTMEPTLVSRQDLVFQLIQSAQNPNLVPLGAAIPDTALLPQRALETTLNALIRKQALAALHYPVPGLPKLQLELAKRLALSGAQVDPSDIVITSGAQEAMYLSLKALTRAGDIVAIESPSYWGLLQVIESLGLKAIEIPTHPGQGISLEALQLALEQWPIKACILVPNYSNPMGNYIENPRKQTLVSLAERFGLLLIEDDIYGDMSFDHHRPRTLLSFSTQDAVIHCGSASKTVSPALRIGWAISHKHTATIAYQKFITNCAAPAHSQLVLAELLASGKYQRNLKTLQNTLAQSAKQLLAAIDRYFPEGTKATQPRGGCALWVELPLQVDAVRLTQTALAEGISIAPGPIFSTTAKYNHCIRLSFGMVWAPKYEEAVRKLGQLIYRQLLGRTS